MDENLREIYENYYLAYITHQQELKDFQKKVKESSMSIQELQNAISAINDEPNWKILVLDKIALMLCMEYGLKSFRAEGPDIDNVFYIFLGNGAIKILIKNNNGEAQVRTKDDWVKLTSLQQVVAEYA